MVCVVRLMMVVLICVMSMVRYRVSRVMLCCLMVCLVSVVSFLVWVMGDVFWVLDV